MKILIDSDNGADIVKENFLSFAIIPIIKSNRNTEVHLCVSPLTYYIFDQFEILDKTLISSLFGYEPNYVNYPDKIIGKFTDDEVVDKPFNSCFLKPFIPDFTLVKSFLSLKQNKSVLPDLGGRKVCVFSKMMNGSMYDDMVFVKPLFGRYVQPEVSECESGVQLTIHIRDFMLNISYFDVLIGEGTLFEYLSCLSTKKKIVITPSILNNEDRFIEYAKIYHNIQRFDFSGIEAFSFDLIKKEL